MARGPYTFAELKRLLYTAADPSYLAPFFSGDYGNGRELFEQMLAVFQRVDEAINRSLQALYILPSSGQTAPPAAGASRTLLTVRVGRARRSDLALTLGAGGVLFFERATDWSDDGGEVVETQRTYTLVADLTFLPGDTVSKDVQVIATTVGYGFANPAPETITGIFQPGDTFQNDGASIAQGLGPAVLTLADKADALTPGHVGQYIELVGGANIGKVRRIVGYTAAATGNGGAVSLAGTFVGRTVATAPAGLFELGEQVFQEDTTGPTTIATGVVLAVSGTAPGYIVVETLTGLFQPTAGTIGPVTGVVSGATFPVEDVIDDGKLVNESGSAIWRVLPWDAELGVSVTNPEGAEVVPGGYPILDALGEERKIFRSPGEDDESYRQRVEMLADVVSPNAVRRAGNRIWARYGWAVCLREVGLQLFPGVYADSPPGAVSNLAKYAYDLDGLNMRGVKTGEFFDGETVVQDNGGVLSYGRVTTTLPPAAPGAPVPPVDPLYLDIAAVRGAFTVGAVVTGTTSGATFVPGSIVGGLRPEDRFKCDLDYTEFRAFFEVGVPPPALGEFGIPYDPPHPYNAFDAAPYLTFADGFPVTSASLNRATYQAIDSVRAGGVGFDLYVERIGCF